MSSIILCNIDIIAFTILSHPLILFAIQAASQTGWLYTIHGVVDVVVGPQKLHQDQDIDFKISFMINMVERYSPQ